MKNISHKLLPVLTAAEMKHLDRTVLKYGFSTEQLMELAGFSTAHLIRSVCKDGLQKESVVVVSGKGNNGGDGVVAARYLSNWGANVSILLVEDKENCGEMVKRQLQQIKYLPIKICNSHKEKVKDIFDECNIIVDAIFGFSLASLPKAVSAEIIYQINDSKKTVFAIDCPSGLNVTTGEIYRPCVKADYTITLAAIKTGFLMPNVKDFLGELFLADIGIPPVLFEQMKFRKSYIFEDVLVKVDSDY